MSCAHDRCETFSRVTNVEMPHAPAVYVLEVSILCCECKRKFRFRGLPHALLRVDGPSRNFDGTMLTVPLDCPLPDGSN
jgi:hypothetical protein